MLGVLRPLRLGSPSLSQLPQHARIARTRPNVSVFDQASATGRSAAVLAKGVGQCAAQRSEARDCRGCWCRIIGFAHAAVGETARGGHRRSAGCLAALRAAPFQGTRCSPRNSWDYNRAAVTGSSHYDLPRVLHWFTGNIGYHHIHHLAPRIPNYRLRAAFESSPLLQRAPRLTLRTSLGCARLKLWDEERGCMVGLAAARRAGPRRLPRSDSE